ncbi:hypothetical protein ASPZODRAFT_1740489 [Penicilliopsis zonata CBS 506.65]|uniref:Transcription factor SipA3 n=1 Tax=Penicilliopsis zonata CBS 506.65 TaxID=1073090 RepID=A0A1L9SKH3_9EURO|nr:hypothetical protein ASPZODRAFT_1740489 [Penicilliopsis zonata CBS 506.65]OJJ47665.1 hypothetical protein ASPZODRAFT_1740489 [Penicilliopsis zonata CBS 506.65]
MSTQPQNPLPQVGKLVSVVPVGLKEAALDSPTFRATTVHFADQIEYLERWLDGYARATTKLTTELAALESAVSSFTAYSINPLTTSEAVIDHDYTLLAMKRCGDCSKELWNGLISTSKRLDAEVADPIRNFINGELRNFKETRRILDQAQKHYDYLQSRYSGQNKTKEPSALREDAFQLHESRKAYLKASLDFSVQAPQLRNALDRLLVRVSFDQWRELKILHLNNGATFGKWGQEMDRIKGWIHEMEGSERSSRRELLAARKQIEDSAELAARPSRELDDYSISTVPYLGTRPPSNLDMTGEVRPEKQGWLNLRTLAGKPTRTTWVRRWAFLKNGIFGCLVQGARTGGVEESERIGVLLCSIRPAFQEERRFCFEVKTKNNSIMLQAETQKELTEWIGSFEAAKQKALENPASTDLSISGKVTVQDPAFSISQPPAPEFAADPADSLTPNAHDESGTSDRNGMLPLPEREGLAIRNSSDFGSSRRLTGTEPEKDHASRIIQKLDLHRKSNSNYQPSPTSPSGGIASLIAASHNVLPNIGSWPFSGLDGETASKGHPLAVLETAPTTLAPPTLANPPAPTSMSKAAVVVSYERGIGLGLADSTGGMPSGMMANLWGSSNWGFLNKLEYEAGQADVKDQADEADQASSSVQQPSSSSENLPKNAVSTDVKLSEPPAPPTPPRQQMSGPRHRQTVSLDNSAAKIQRAAIGASPEYPDYYPPRLKTQDSQFRLLFPNVKRDEPLVMVFRATWGPNDQQEFPGRAYVTSKNVFFYSHYNGLVLTTSCPLKNIAEVTAAPGRDCDFLFLHTNPPSGTVAPGRITIKTFLEPLRLLQKRLNFMVRESTAIEPMSLDSVFKALLKMESEAPVRTPSLDSWEDISLHTAADANNAAGPSSQTHDIRVPIYIEKDLDLIAGKEGRGKDAMKFRLPTQPVEYVPQGNLHLAAEKILDISPRALFHVLFGDKSAVWQLLLHERRAKDITQGPWIRNESRHLRRDLQYSIETSDLLGRSRDTAVSDYQIIDVLNEHLCYVVTDKRTPWHLPFRRSFRLVSKIVITFVSKSKSKLAIYTKVEWLRSPYVLQRVVDKQAANDLEQDALDLVDLVSDQARRLGVHSRTKKAITIFGHVGRQTQTSRFTGAGVNLKLEKGRCRTQRTLARLVFEICISFLESAISSVMIWTFALLRWIWKTANANQIILLLLTASMAFNGFYSLRDTYDWWHERNAGRFVSRMGIRPDTVMSKAIYVRDIDEAITNSTIWHRQADHNATDCFATFQEELSQDRTNAFSLAAASGPRDFMTKAATKRFQQTREQLGMYRHDLVVALRVVNSIEREVIQSEWERWLREEMRRCRQVETLLNRDELESGSAEAGHEIFAEHTDGVREWYEMYCASCRREQEHVDRSPPSNVFEKTRD